jgi:hypothetical protein
VADDKVEDGDAEKEDRSHFGSSLETQDWLGFPAIL